MFFNYFARLCLLRNTERYRFLVPVKFWGAWAKQIHGDCPRRSSLPARRLCSRAPCLPTGKKRGGKAASRLEKPLRAHALPMAGPKRHFRMEGTAPRLGTAVGRPALKLLQPWEELAERSPGSGARAAALSSRLREEILLC